MIKDFQAKEAGLNQLVRMSNEDPRVIRIAYDFTRLDKNWAWACMESQLGFSNQRCDEYRAIIKMEVEE